MNYDIKQFYVVKADEALLTSGTTTDLNAGQVGIFKGDFTALVAAPTGLQAPYIFLAQGSGVDSRGSFKTPKIYLNKITAWYGDSADSVGKDQITYVGYDEINDCKTPTIACEKDYTLIIRVFEHYLRAVYQPYLQEGFVVKAPCCTDCGTDCDDLGAFDIMTEFAAKINASPRLSPYVTASVVSKVVSGTPTANKYGLVLPDPGTNVGGVASVKLNTTAATGFTDGAYTGITMTSTSGSGSAATYNFTVAGGILTAVSVNAAGTGYVTDEVITFAGTKITGGTTPADDFTITVTSTTGAEGVLLDAVRAFYTSKVDNILTDIVYSADAESLDGDANSTGNVMIEMTASAGVTLADLENYNGLEWTVLPCLTPGDAVYEVGIKLAFSTPTGFSSTCMPDAVPYIANKTRAKVYAGEAPGGSQLEDMPNFCNLWEVTTTQEVKYPVGAGYAIAEIERWTKGNDVAGAASKRYWQNYFNDDTIPYFVDTTLEYDIYYLKYLNPQAGAGFEHATNEPLEIAVAVPSTMTAWKTAFETVMNGWVALSPAYQGPVVL